MLGCIQSGFLSEIKAGKDLIRTHSGNQSLEERSKDLIWVPKGNES